MEYLPNPATNLNYVNCTFKVPADMVDKVVRVLNWYTNKRLEDLQMCMMLTPSLSDAEDLVLREVTKINRVLEADWKAPKLVNYSYGKDNITILLSVKPKVIYLPSW